MRDRCSILVVDDDDISLAVIAMLLESEGYEVLQASSGEEALETIAGLEVGTKAPAPHQFDRDEVVWRRRRSHSSPEPPHPNPLPYGARELAVPVEPQRFKPTKHGRRDALGSRHWRRRPSPSPQRGEGRGEGVRIDVVWLSQNSLAFGGSLVEEKLFGDADVPTHRRSPLTPTLSPAGRGSSPASGLGFGFKSPSFSSTPSIALVGRNPSRWQTA